MRNINNTIIAIELSQQIVRAPLIEHNDWPHSPVLRGRHREGGLIKNQIISEVWSLMMSDVFRVKAN